MVYIVRSAAALGFSLFLASIAAGGRGPVAAAQAPTPAAATSPAADMTPAPVMAPPSSASSNSTGTPVPAGMSSPSASPSPTTSAALTASGTNPPENPLITDRVRAQFTAWQNGRIDRKQYSGPAGGTYNDALVKVVQPDLTAIGPLQSVRYRMASLLLGDVVYRYDVTGTSGVVSVLYSLDAQGKTDGIVFTPQVFRNSFLAP